MTELEQCTRNSPVGCGCVGVCAVLVKERADMIAHKDEALTLECRVSLEANQ